MTVRLCSEQIGLLLVDNAASGNARSPKAAEDSESLCTCSGRLSHWNDSTCMHYELCGSSVIDVMRYLCSARTWTVPDVMDSDPDTYPVIDRRQSPVASLG